MYDISFRNFEHAVRQSFLSLSLSLVLLLVTIADIQLMFVAE